MLNDRVTLLGVALLSGVAVAGWMRQPETAVAASNLPVNNFVPAAEMMAPEADLAPLPASVTPVQNVSWRGGSAPVQTVQYRQTRRPRASRYSDMGSDSVYDANATYSNRRARSAAAYDYRTETVNKRSTRESIAIVGGSAAAGAAIGGLAGGGKGAAIGALTGGAGGLVYDRMTNKRRVPADDNSYPATYGYRNDEYRDDEYRGEGRSKTKSATIIGGGAAAGAAVGAMTGGGKGAAIGALTGGAAGLIYDRMTKNR